MLNPLPCATYAFVMSITPGPNNVMLTAAGAAFGLRRTVPHLLGVGAAYLVFLGWQLLRSRGATVGSAGTPLTFWEAASFQFLNPKAWVIALTAATLFRPSALGPALAIPYVTAIVTFVNLPCITVWALFGSALGRALTRPAARRSFNWTMAAALAATGIMMVT